MAKKKTYYPVVMCGTYFPEDLLLEMKKAAMEEHDDKMNLLDFLSALFQAFDYKEVPYMKNVIMLSTENCVFYPEEDFDKGYFIGVDILELPEHLSKKRMQIDVRKIFEGVGILSIDDEDSAIQIFARTIFSA
jgi:hypothetical protein